MKPPYTPSELAAELARWLPPAERTIVETAGYGQRIGVSEGAEATMPFLPAKKPVDAYCACLLDTVEINQRRELR